jgi:hypothetical protein
MSGNQKQLWDYMQFYIQGAGQAGRLKTGVELANVIGMALGLASEANPHWFHDCVRDGWRTAGMDGAGYAQLVSEARDLIAEIEKRQLAPGDLDDIAAMKIRKAGLG